MSRRLRRLLPLGILLSLACEGEPRDFLGSGGGPPGGAARLALRIGNTGTDEVTDLVTDAAGAVFVTGTFTGSVDFDPSAGTNALVSLGGKDVFVAKYSATHALVWVAQLGGPGDEAALALALDPGGEVVVAGWYEGSPDFDPGSGLAVLPSAGGRDGFVVKLSATGSLTWARRFGGLADDRLVDVTTDAGAVYAAGEFEGAADGQPTGHTPIAAPGADLDAVILSFALDGSPTGAIPFGGLALDRATGVAVNAGFLYVGGTFNGSVDFDPTAGITALTPFGGADGFLASYTTAGALQWVHPLGGTTEDGVRAVGVGNGLIQAAGTFTGTADFDPGPGITAGVSLGLEDGFVAQFDATGALSSLLTLGGTAADSVTATVAGGGDLIVTGTFASAVDFDPGAGTTALTPVVLGGTDAFVARYGPAGQLLWARRFGSGLVGDAFRTAPFGLALEASGRTVFGGSFHGNLDADPGSGLFALASLGDADGFVIRLTPAGGLAP